MSGDWKTLCASRKQRQLDAIPAQWRIDPPPEERRNVLHVPLACGILTAREVDITETLDVEAILAKLHSAQWSSEEVTTAFYKRAIIAHQLVRLRVLTRIPSEPPSHAGLLTVRSSRDHRQTASPRYSSSRRSHEPGRSTSI